MKTSLVGLSVIIALAALVVGLAALNKPVAIVGAAPGPEHTEKQIFNGGVQYGNNSATSSSAGGTLTAGDFREWVNSDFVVITPTGANSPKTFTLPASSSVPSILPQVGDTARTCVYNATSGPRLVFAAGTGFDLEVASSSATAVGALNLDAGATGCFTFIRQPATASTHDITVLYHSYKDAD